MSDKSAVFSGRPAWFIAAIFGDDGLLAKSRYFQALPGHHEQDGERLISGLQFGLALLMVALSAFGFIGSREGVLGAPVILAIVLLGTSSLVRWRNSQTAIQSDSQLDILNCFDAFSFSVLAILCFQSSSASSIGNASDIAAIWIGLFASVRLVRVHPRPIIVSGIAAVIALLSVRLVANRLLPSEIGESVSVTGSTLVVFSLLVCVMTYAVWQARKTLGYLNATLENMPHGVALFDKKNQLIVSNSQYSLLYGLTDVHRKRGTSIAELIRYRHEAGCFGEVEYQSHANDWMDSFDATEPSIQQLDDGRIFSILRQREESGRLVTTTEDITSQRRLEARVEYLAYHDALTGLANRTQLRHRLGKILQRETNRDNVTTYCLDLDRFKEINDTLGHEIGDELLKAVGQRLRGCVKEGDIVARTGGDEFVILQLGPCSPQGAAHFAQRTIDCLSEPYQLRGYQMQIGTSVGIAFFNEQNGDANNLIKNADIALYKAKESGRGVFCFYHDSMGRRLKERRKVESDLRRAMERGEFELHYQPVLNAERGHIESMEALIRWQHPERGMVSPADFLPIVDEIGLASSLGSWVFAQACRDAAKISNTIKVSVNVSAVQFQRPGLAEAVASALYNSGLPARRLEIEITETVLLENTETTLQTLQSLQDLGVRIALDDFGTGYSSLSYLQKFSFDRLKIDRSFVKDSLTDSSSSAIIRSVIELGHSLGMKITAEGVETDEQLVRVTDDGCTAIQGFLISRPLPIAEFDKFLLAQKDLRQAIGLSNSEQSQTG